MLEINSEHWEKCMGPENFSSISQIIIKNFKQNIRKLRNFPFFSFSLTLSPNNFQTVIDSEKCFKSTQNIGKNAYDLKISAQSVK